MGPCRIMGTTGLITDCLWCGFLFVCLLLFCLFVLLVFCLFVFVLFLLFFSCVDVDRLKIKVLTFVRFCIYFSHKASF